MLEFVFLWAVQPGVEDKNSYIERKQNEIFVYIESIMGLLYRLRRRHSTE